MNKRTFYLNTEARTADWDPPAEGKSSRETGLDFMARLVGRLPMHGGRFLDIGCQAGHLVNAVKDRFNQSVGVDIGNYDKWWQMIDGAEFLTHDLDSGRLPFPANHFDVVTCFMVLEHVFDVFGAVEEIARLTKPGKHAIIEVPNAGYVKHVLGLLRGRVPRTGSQNFPFERSKGWDGQHLHYFALRELSWLCREFALTPIEHTSRGNYLRLRALCPTLLYASIVLVLRKET